MLESLLKECYNTERKIWVDFSGFGHLFATQLFCDSCVAFFVARISEVLAEWRTISIWKMIFYLLSRRAAAYGLSSGTCICWGSERCTGSRDLRPYRRRTSILHHYCNYRPQIPAGNRQVKRRNDGEQHSPLLWRACRGFDFGKWLRKYLCGGRKLPETLRGVGAIALGYPAQEAGQPAARKQNYIVRI